MDQHLPSPSPSQSPQISRRTLLVGAGAGAAALASGTVLAQPAAASVAVGGKPATRASVAADGSWQITTANPAWTLGGSVGATTTGTATRSGHDVLGPYQETTFAYNAGGARRGSIRAYAASSIVVFTDTFVDAATYAAPFPAVSSYPTLDYQLSHQGTFGVYQFNTFANAGDSPWLHFDSTGRTFLISAANYFTQTQTSFGGDGTITPGLDSAVADVPAGFSRRTILVAGNGIGATYRTWGSALTALSGKTLPANDADTVLEKLGYWTDHGAVYYYTYESSLGYTGTLQAVVADWKSKNLPIGYMQLDSWWYPKGPNADWSDLADGEYSYTAAPALFPDGLAAFQKSVGLPLVTHARWIDPSSPYNAQYKMSGDVSIDPAFWQSVMAYLKDAGVIVYEQDWLSEDAQPVYNLTDPDGFYGNMSRYASRNGLNIQYCMSLPRDYLQTTLFDNLTTIRVSDDRFEQSKWNEYLYDSQLAASLGVWPWSDVFMSTETDNLVLSTLSAGPVGVGDAIGAQSAANILQVARPDGVIVKPDVPIVPIDATYLGEAAGDLPAMVAAAYVRHTGLSHAYVFSYARQTPAPQAVYQAEDAILHGPVVATDNPGYTGTGYADYQNNTGDYVQWTVQAPSAGTYTLLFRYANGGTGPRPLDITLNGGDVGDLAFDVTGSWTDWVLTGLVVTLEAGTNTVRATSIGENGANVDYLGVSQGVAPTVPTQTVELAPSELGIPGAAYVYDYYAGQGERVPAGGTYQATVTSGSYWLVAPVGRSGIAVLGDAGKFVGTGKKRIASLSDDGEVRATIAFAEGEDPITLHGYAPAAPRVTASQGHAGTVEYDQSTGVFSVQITPSRAATAQITLRPTA